jgi:hypothetical protein
MFDQFYLDNNMPHPSLLHIPFPKFGISSLFFQNYNLIFLTSYNQIFITLLKQLGLTPRLFMRKVVAAGYKFP